MGLKPFVVRAAGAKNYHLCVVFVIFRACGAKDASSEIPDPARFGRDFFGRDLSKTPPDGRDLWEIPPILGVLCELCPRLIPHPLSPFGELLQIGFTTNDSEFLLVGAGRDVCRGARIEIHVHD